MIERLYDSKAFSELAAIVSDKLVSHLEAMTKSSTTLSRSTPPTDLAESIRADLASGPKTIGYLASRFLENSRALHSPHYIGHQVPPPLPVASLFSWMAALSNQGGAVTDMSPFYTPVERVLIDKVGQKVGWKVGDFSGILTNGGTLANLTALLAARNRAFPKAWEDGTKDGVILTSGESHYSISRAAGVIGIGTRQVVKVDLDSKRRMDPEAARRIISKLKNEGRKPFALVASVCSTPTGSFDPISELSSLAREEGLWLHADGAHGASTLFSKKHRSLLKGIENADTITWDAHKMMHVPHLCTFLLYKEKARSFDAFKQDAPYLFDPNDIDKALWDQGLRTLECTKQAIALPLWGVWSLYGEEIFEQIIDQTFALTREFHDLLKASTDFEPVHEPQANIQCFRYTGQPDREKEIRTKLVNSGEFFITLTRIDGRFAFRVTITNPLTTLDHLARLLSSIRSLAH